MKTKFIKISLLAFSLILFGGGCSIGPGGNDVNTGGPAGVFVTTDDGEQWNQINKLPTADGVQNLQDVSVYRLFKDPLDPDALYWASRGSGLYYSYDKGKTWRKDDGLLANTFVYSIAIHPDDKCILFGTDGVNVYRSTDCARSWKKVHKEDRSNAKITSLTFQKNEPYKLFMSKENGDFLGTSDLGSSWQIMKRFNGSPERIYTDKQHEGMVYMATENNGLFRSNDLGQNWTNLKEKLQEFAQGLDFHRAEVFPGNSNKIFWAAKYGILVSDDKGDSWESLNLITSPGTADIWSIAIHPEDDNKIYYTATVKEKSTFYLSKDGGDTWSTKELPTGQWPVSLKIHSENPNIIYAGFMNPTQEQ